MHSTVLQRGLYSLQSRIWNIEWDREWDRDSVGDKLMVYLEVPSFGFIKIEMIINIISKFIEAC